MSCPGSQVQYTLSLSLIGRYVPKSYPQLGGGVPTRSRGYGVTRLHTDCTQFLHEPICFIYLSRITPYSTSPLLSSASISSPASLPASIMLSAILPSTMPRYIPYFSHHLCDNRAPVRNYTARHSSSILQIVMYWMMVFFQIRIYLSTSSIPNATISSSIGGQSHRPSMSLFGCIPGLQQSTLWWNLPRLLPVLGFITQVSEPNNRFA